MCMIRKTPYLDKTIYYHSYTPFNSTLDPWTTLPLPPWIFHLSLHLGLLDNILTLTRRLPQHPSRGILDKFPSWHRVISSHEIENMRNRIILAELLLVYSRVYKAPCFENYPSSTNEIH